MASITFSNGKPWAQRAQEEGIGPLKDWFDSLTDEERMAAVRENPWAMFYIRKQTPDMCMFAVQQFPMLLVAVQHQTPEICLEAIQRNWNALQYVKEQTAALCTIALQRDVWAIRHIRHPTPEMCLFAVQKNGMTLDVITRATPEICLAAVQQNYRALQFAVAQTPAICRAAMQQNRNALQYIRWKPAASFLTWAEQRERWFQMDDRFSPEKCMEAVRRDWRYLEFITEQTPEMCTIAVQAHTDARDKGSHSQHRTRGHATCHERPVSNL